MTRGRHPEREDKLIAAIRAAGSIRTKELSDATGVQGNNIGTALAAAIARGDVYVCKVTPGPGQTGRSTNEYRIGGGKPPPEFVPLNPRRAALASMAASVRRTPSAQPTTGTLPARTEWPATPVFLSSTTPQPAVGNTGSAQLDLISSDERAVTSATETPGPQPERRGMGPAPAKAPAGDVFSITLDDAGVLVIATDEGVIELQPAHAKRLGHFMGGSQGVWNPF